VGDAGQKAAELEPLLGGIVHARDQTVLDAEHLAGLRGPPEKADELGDGEAPVERHEPSRTESRVAWRERARLTRGSRRQLAHSGQEPARRDRDLVVCQAKAWLCVEDFDGRRHLVVVLEWLSIPMNTTLLRCSWHAVVSRASQTWATISAAVRSRRNPSPRRRKTSTASGSRTGTTRTVSRGTGRGGQEHDGLDWLAVAGREKQFSRGGSVIRAVELFPSEAVDRENA